MLKRFLNLVRNARECLNLTSIDHFSLQQNKIYSLDEIQESLKFMISASAADYISLKHVFPYLHAILYYLSNQSVKSPQIQQLIKAKEQILIQSALQILSMYKAFLKKVVPTNITYFHFMRQSQLYIHYVAIRYILIVGHSVHLRKMVWTDIFSKLGQFQRISLFELLIHWISNMVNYKCSAIYFKQNSINELIDSTFILICGLLGKSHQNSFDQVDHKSKKQLFNKLMFVAIYILCIRVRQANKKNFYIIAMCVSCLRKMLNESDIPDIDTFIPSYLFVDMIGFIHCPLSYQIVLRVLIYFLTTFYQNQQEDYQLGKQKQKFQNQYQQKLACENFVTPLTQINIWGVINLIIEKYGTYNPKVLGQFIKLVIPKIKPWHISRTFCLKIIEQLNLDLTDNLIKEFYNKNQYPYSVQEKILSISLVARNFRAFMEAIYMNYVQQSIIKKQVILGRKTTFLNLLKFNTNEIITLQIYKEQALKRQKQNNKNQF